ncbi:MAG: Gfo/Idh/MocA family protein [Phototrophicaceae bacterium]|jgi:predicted dehydrogenase
MPDFTLQTRAELPSTPLPIVSIGMGGIVHDAHYPAYQIAGLPVIGGYDRDHERAEVLARKFRVPVVFDTLQEAVRESPTNAVFDVAVPGKNILEVLDEIPDGRAVLIQKPMGDTFDEARAILALCRKKQLTAAINFQMRFMPHIIAARSMLQQGLIGDLWDIEVRMQIYTPWETWPFLLSLPRLEILYHSIHYIDLVRSFCGTPQSVYAKTLQHPVTPELSATRTTMIFDYGDNPRANIMTNHGHIYGDDLEQAYVKLEGSKGAIYVQSGLNMNYPKGKADIFRYVLLDGTTPRHELHWQSLEVEGSWFPHAFIGTMSSLQRFVLGESDVLPTSVEDAFQTMGVVEAAYESSAAGGTPIPLA